jgi:hypothetical protein
VCYHPPAQERKGDPVQNLASPRTQSKAHQPDEALLAVYADGSIIALSRSEPGRTYRVELAPLSCECPGFQYRGSCYHTVAAVERFTEVESVVCWSCGASLGNSEAKLGTNGRAYHADYDACQRRVAGVRRLWGWR